MGTTRAAADLCVTTSDVGSGMLGDNTWDGALHDCAALGMRLPSPTEGMLLLSATASGTNHWTDDFYSNATSYFGRYYLHDATYPTGDVFQAIASSQLRVRCVTTPVNS